MKIIPVLPLLFSGVLFAQTMSVQVKNTYLRTSPSFLGKKITQLKYADKVTVNKERNSWINVYAPAKNKNGWIHSSALSNKRIMLKQSESTGHVASKSEIVMAGKGFSKEVESQYKQRNSSLNYRLVDQIERLTISNDRIIRFAQKGSLNLAE